eukprot:11190905-Lingulodinium_polyedra.AAC.1
MRRVRCRRPLRRARAEVPARSCTDARARPAPPSEGGHIFAVAVDRPQLAGGRFRPEVRDDGA